VITDLGVEIYREDINVVGVWQVSTCSVTTREYDFGELTSLAPNKVLGVIPFPLAADCNGRYPSETPTHVTFSSPHVDVRNSGFLDPSVPGIYMQIRDSATTYLLDPGYPYALSRGENFDARLVQTASDVSGSFSFVIDVTLSYD